MFISHKSNVIQQVNEVEWQCRRLTKGMSKPEYWAWLETITSDDDPPVIDYSGETGYTIVECTDEDVSARLVQLSDYQAKGVYNIKYYVTKRDSEIEGVKSHFIGDDSAKEARILADKWANVRSERNQKLAETDYLALGDNTLSTACLLYTSPSPRDPTKSRMPSSA